MTKAVSKQLLPVYDKPMIYYPLSVLLLAGINEILIILTPHDLPMYKKLLRDGSKIGIRLEYAGQPEPRGIAEAFIIGEDFIGGNNVCLILGDNIFYGQFFTDMLTQAINNINNKNGAVVFGYPVKNPRDFGVWELNDSGKILSTEEKPIKPKSHYAIPGLYFYDNEIVKVSRNIKPSERGELEIKAVNNEYLKKDILNVILMGRVMT